MEKILIIREQDFRSKKKTLEYRASELEFPEWFGNNLDALMDCLTDVWEPTNIALDPLPDEEPRSWYSDICEVILDAAAENSNISVFRAVRPEPAEDEEW